MLSFTTECCHQILTISGVTNWSTFSIHSATKEKTQLEGLTSSQIAFHVTLILDKIHWLPKMRIDF